MPVHVTLKADVATVTLSWPERRNALGPGEGRELLSVLDELAFDEALRGLVLTGDGAFCAGGDLAALRVLVREGPDAVRSSVYGIFQGIIRRLIAFPVPTVAAVNGAAVGLGMDLALACDRRFVSDAGWFMQGWAAIGLIPGTGGALLFRHRTGRDVSDILTQGRVGPDCAEKLGLAVSVESDAVAAAHDDLASRSQLPDLTLRSYVALERSVLRDAIEKHLALCVDLQVALLTAPEFLQRTEKFVH